jgi:FtsH-binding integral membrane protein
MTQTQTQFQRPLLQIGSIAFLAGVVMVIASTAIHPSSENPANHLLVFTEYASDESWIAVHIGQFAGVVIVFAGGFVALYRLLAQTESSTLSVLAWIGLALAIMAAGAYSTRDSGSDL